MPDLLDRYRIALATVEALEDIPRAEEWGYGRVVAEAAGLEDQLRHMALIANRCDPESTAPRPVAMSWGAALVVVTPSELTSSGDRVHVIEARDIAAGG